MIDLSGFKSIGEDLYVAERAVDAGTVSILFIAGSTSDLSFIPDSSFDGIITIPKERVRSVKDVATQEEQQEEVQLITDHPYSLKASLKGGNRNFADYDLFQYTEQDFLEKQRVLRQGCFCVEFLPEENGDNYEYLFRVKDMARKSGLEYYAQVPWQKQGFIANTGRKSKDTENIVFFTKGRARELRPDAKKDKQYENNRAIVEYKDFIPGGTTVHYSDMGGMGSSSETEIKPIEVDIRLSVAKEEAEKIKDLLDKGWHNAVVDSFDKSPLDKDNGGSYSLEALFDMPVQEYMLRYLDSHGISYVDLSPGVKDIFKASTDVIVNPTNLMGPMGAGLAKQFKELYPNMEEFYKFACKSRAPDSFRDKSDRPGRITFSSFDGLYAGDLFYYMPSGSINNPEPPAVICFPTKRDWRDPSSLELIEAGLLTFTQCYKDFRIKSVTFPKLGCGLGGLNWEKEVKPLMQKYLGDLPDLEVQICGDTLKVDKQEHFMSGAAGMLPCSFSISPVSKKDKIHQAEKPVELLKQILEYVTLPGETALDQFAGSGVLGEAALETGRNSILIEKDVEAFNKLTQRLQMLGTVEAVTPAAQTVLTIGADAMVAQDAFNRTGDRNIVYNFVKTHDMPDPEVFFEGEKDLRKNATPEQAEAISKVFEAYEDIDLRSSDLDLDQFSSGLHAGNKSGPDGQDPPKVLECSSRGDRRFSALFATVTIKGKEQSIEQWYQNAKRSADGKKAGKGKPFDHIIDPFTGDKLPAKDAADLYRGLWITYLSKNPDLVEYASQFDEFSNMFGKKGLENSPEEVIGVYVKGNRDWYVASVKSGHWYKNMASKMKAPLSQQISSAEEKGKKQNGYSDRNPNRDPSFSGR